MKAFWIFLIGFTVHQVSSRVKDEQCSIVKSIERLDCYPEAFASESKCIARGCCWRSLDALQHEVAPPTCYFPATYPAYYVTSKNVTQKGMVLRLNKRNPQNVYSEEFENAQLEIIYETEERLRLRFTNPMEQRWEPPIPLEPPKDKVTNQNYSVHIMNEPFGLKIKFHNKTLVEFSKYLSTALILSDQFLQVTFKINAHFGFGLGERRIPFPLNLHKWDRAGMWNRDMPPTEDVNLYGTHNFFVGLDEQGDAFGLFFLNSNAQEVAVQPLPALTYRTTGGILDFFVFIGPSPKEVVAQYIKLIGKPTIPPYWSLGFHLCRYGYENIGHVKDVLERNKAADIPLDVQWFDIDYMDSEKDWTYDPVNFNLIDDFIVNRLHKKYKMRNVIIVDPAINIISNYDPYKKGVEMGIFINDSRTGKPLIGQVWPGETLFPDFTHPRIHDWWSKSALEFHKQVPFDGLWIDMNEPSNFVDGSKTGCIEESLLDNPPYVPQVIGGSLYSRTLCPSALHYNTTHYNLHNIYGFTEAQVTRKTLEMIFPGKRQFLLSRSTFSGSGRYTFHWTGDNISTWNDLLASIAQVINFNIFGIPMTGADICGFNGQTTDELCLRWSQLGAFYPFSRNHNTLTSRAQDPAVFSSETVKAIRDVIRFRYFLLPYFFSLFYRAQLEGAMVVRPLAFEFPIDPSTYKINDQFMLGSCILVSPVVEEGLTSIYTYLPKGEWIFAPNSSRIVSSGLTYLVDAPLEIIPIHFKAGCTIPLQRPNSTTTFARENGIGLLVILLNEDYGEHDPGMQSEGELFWDDGETEDQPYLYVKFIMINRKLQTLPKIVPSTSGNSTIDFSQINVLVDFVLISGIKKKPHSVEINGQKAQNFSYDRRRSLVKLTGNQRLSWADPISIKYSF